MEAEEPYNAGLYTTVPTVLGDQCSIAKNHASGRQRGRHVKKQVASVKGAVRGLEPLIIFLALLPSDLFTKSLLVVQSSLRSPSNKCQTHLTSLLDIDTTNIAFVDVAIARHVCKVLQISFILLAKPKPVRGFDSQPASNIIHIIYPTLIMQVHSKLLAPMFVIKLGQHLLILNKP